MKELLGERRQEYEGHCDIDYTSEAKKFLEPDFYTSGLGNTMPLALATALQLPIAIFSTDTTRSTMYVSPVNVTSTATSFVVYDPSDEGHYAAALPFNNHTSVSNPPPTTVSCRCGSNKEASKVAPTSCIQNPRHQGTTEPCT